jgi:F-box-like
MSDDATTPEGFDKVPDEILVKIMSYIQHDHFRNVRLVNRRFNRVSYTPSLWKTVRILIYCRNVEIWIDARWMFEKIEG